MPPLVIPNVCRYTVHQQIGGQPVVNVIDMQVDTTGSTVSREDAIHDVAGDILNNWDDHMLTFQRPDLQAQEVRWLDLNSLDGSTGSRSRTDANTWPANGREAAGTAMPAVVAMRVDKATSGGRGTKRGRMYLSGLNETNTEASVTQSWRAEVVAGVNTALAALLAGINDQGSPPADTDVQRQMVVVHASRGDYSPVTALTVNPNVSTQVRRGVLR